MGARLNKAINVGRRDKTPTEIVNTPCCNRHMDHMHMDWFESVRVVNGPASILSRRIPASVAVLQLLRQAFLSHLHCQAAWSSERLFSTADDFCSDKRSCPSSENVARLVFLDFELTFWLYRWSFLLDTYIRRLRISILLSVIASALSSAVLCLNYQFYSLWLLRWFSDGAVGHLNT